MQIDPKELEPEMEELLLRLMPQVSEHWEGATEFEIEQLEQIAGRPLPRFYRWFLLRMGRSMGPLAIPDTDFSAAKLLSCYASGEFAPDPRFFMIAHQSEGEMRLHTAYDFEFPERDDARVVFRGQSGGPVHARFDTFRELIGWSKFVNHRVMELPMNCVGTLMGENADVRSQLDPLMQELGFNIPLPSGARCAIYDRDDLAMATSSRIGDKYGVHTFDLGGSDTGMMRKVLGEIAEATSLDLEVDEWDPALEA